MFKNLPFKRRLMAACCAFGIALGMPFAAAIPLKYETTPGIYLALTTLGDSYGVCSGDLQIPATRIDGIIETKIIDYPVGTAIKRNSSTMKGYADIENIISAANTYSLTSLYHFFLDIAGQDDFHSRSFALAVQLLLDSAPRIHSIRPSDGGAYSEEMLKKARAFAGPYEIMGTVEPSGRNLQLRDLGVKTSQGNWFPDAKLTLEVTGPAQFSDGTTTRTLTTTADGEVNPQTLQVQGAGEVSVKVKAENLPAEIVQIYEMYTYQDLISVPNKTSSLEKTFTYDSTLAPVDFSFSTHVGAKQVTSGEPVVDNIKVQAAKWQDDLNGRPMGVNLRADLYGPFSQPPAQTPEIPAGIQPIHTQLLTVSAAGDYQTKPLTQSLAVGHYTWVVKAQQSEQFEPTLILNDQAHDFGMPEESFEVLPEPTVPPATQPPVEEPPAPQPPETVETPPALVTAPPKPNTSIEPEPKPKPEPPAEPAPEPEPEKTPEPEPDPAPQPPTTVETTTKIPAPPPTQTSESRLANTGPLQLLPLVGSTCSFGVGIMLLRPRKKEN